MNGRRLIIAGILVLLVFLILVPAAIGRDLEQQPFTHLAPAGHVYGDGLFRAAVADVDRWWRDISGQTPPPLDLAVYTKDDAAAAYASYRSGRVFLTREHSRNWWHTAAPRWRSLSERRSALVEAWGVAAHERGHNLGLEHPSGDCSRNIMCPIVTTTPGRALDWARRILPSSRSKLKMPA